MTIETLFFARDAKLRSGWRFLIFIASFLLCGVIAGSAVTSVFSLLPTGTVPGTRILVFANSAVFLIIALLLGWFWGRYLERVPLRALGACLTEGWGKHLILGILFGAATLIVAVGIASLLGGLRFRINDQIGYIHLFSGLLSSLVVLATAAAFEETLFRGYILQTFARSGLGWFAIALTAIFFGSLHVANPNATVFSTANTVLAGIWFGIAYLKTRDLWFVWGMHLMWNWTQGAIFGIEISGMTDLTSTSILKEVDTGPTWLSGSHYGIEGGIAATVALLLSAILIYLGSFLRPNAELLALTNSSKVEVLVSRS